MSLWVNLNWIRLSVSAEIQKNPTRLEKLYKRKEKRTYLFSGIVILHTLLFHLVFLLLMCFSLILVSKILQNQLKYVF